MGQILHGCATTTHTVRAAIQRSQASAAELSQTLEPGIHAVVALPSASDWADGHAAVRIHLLAVQVPGSFHHARAPVLNIYAAVDSSDQVDYVIPTGFFGGGGPWIMT